MVDKEELWRKSGLHQFQIVQCVVTEHRGRFGIDVDVVTPTGRVPGFIDFVMLADSDEHPSPADFPAVGAVLEAVTLDFIIPLGGELRLTARKSSIERQRAQDKQR
ncbi:hypothetical protein [Actinocrispum wychmicini]|uniref:Uncharacterized protein n=1 Tax=Actinocrispum wychmicini TaxID=1213861 RepID=A0A4R2K2D4_9PSEU|nr:hypothetical protein [Actinocrispum wychmicini]TCO65882.1 hypothetical protein EV192_1011674 [Actinocrispum wychmicini]